MMDNPKCLYLPIFMLFAITFAAQITVLSSPQYMQLAFSEQEQYQSAINHVLKNEGGFVNNKKDPGGATNYGISLRFLKSGNIDINLDGAIDINDIIILDKSKASKIYQEHFWDKHNYSSIRDIQISTKIFDMSVNMGGYQAHKLLQRAINKVHNKKLAVDGIFGKNTLATVNLLIKQNKSQQLLSALKNELENFYRGLVISKPQLKVFLKGWLRRANQ